MDSGQEIALDDEDITRVPLFDEDGRVAGSRLVIDLPADELAAGGFYELTLSENLGIDGEFQQGSGPDRTNGTLPSDNGVAGGDFVQIFQVIEASNYLTNP